MYNDYRIILYIYFNALIFYEFKTVSLTMRRGHTLPRSVQTRPNGEDPEWTNRVSGTRNYPWSQPQRDLASESEAERETVKQISNMFCKELRKQTHLYRNVHLCHKFCSPEMNWRRWKRRSKSMQSLYRILSECLLLWSCWETCLFHTPSLLNTTTWCPATTHLLHS